MMRRSSRCLRSRPEGSAQPCGAVNSSQVHTNPAEWRDGALRVGPYHTQPHGCRHCPSNMCKGQASAKCHARGMHCAAPAHAAWQPNLGLWEGGTGAGTAPSTCARAERNGSGAVPHICHVCTPGQRSPAGLHGPHVNRCPWPLTNSRPPGTDHVPAKQVLAGLLSRQAAEGRAYNRVLYVGDGRGDFCPSALLLHGSNGAAAAAAPPDAAAMPGGGAVGTAAPAPCGSASNVVFAREEYPDGAPCSLWVMLQQAHSVHSGGGRASGEAPQEAAAGGAARRAGGSGTSGGVVGWTTPEQLASLIRAELQLELELR